MVEDTELHAEQQGSRSWRQRWHTGEMTVQRAGTADFPGFLRLASQVEQWFGPLTTDPGFRNAVVRNIDRGSALVAWEHGEVVGGLLVSARPPTYHFTWLVVDEAHRGEGLGRALMAEAERLFVVPPATLEVVTFGPDHPGAVAGGSRAFYESLGFTPSEAHPAGRSEERRVGKEC